MLQSRRIDDRRRRVMLTSASVSASAPSAASRTRMEQLREARRPALAYGSRVRKCLRGRWFSLVPVQRTTVAKLFSVLSIIALALILLNDATARFATLADRPSFVRVFRITEYGSLGRYFTGVMYLALAGSGWMIYQLRRFRNDDFGGHYRVWQWIVSLALISSIGHVVPILAMLGEAIEWVMGKRIALSGRDWIGLFLIIGGAILAMRSIAEMRRYRVSVSLLVVGWLWSTLPISVDWNILTTNTNLRWTLVTSSNLLAVTFWFAASVTYLRSLYFEVRGIEPSAGIIQRLNDSFARRAQERSEAKEEAAGKSPQKPTAKSTARKPAAPKAKTNVAKASTPQTHDADTDDDNEANQSDASDTNAAPKEKRRWFGLLGPAKPKPPKAKKQSSNDSDAASSAEDDAAEPIARTPAKASSVTKETATAGSIDEDSDEGDTNTKSPKKKRSWLPSLRRKAKPAQTDASDESDDQDSNAIDDARVATNKSARPSPPSETDSDEESTDAPKKKSFGLGSLLRRKKKAPADEGAETNDDASSATPSGQSSRPQNAASVKSQPTANQDADDSDDSEPMSEDDIDWSSMNKAERRRMRKQLKRSGRAA
ncbi:membrane protein [Rhodopirellula sallentina]|uniref:Putative membrane protein n=1 Tax=Rhodopirellula sallentina SM41 TaxID=1263870 RepID=M5TYX1_9BACT|nr:membrane protein [Rhodopirellula sallentina]EMI54417.1 putative membrane protein [Rhodopirellula sallentina SM41]